MTTDASRTHGWRQDLLDRCKGLPPIPTAVVHPCELIVLEAAVQAATLGLITPILVGPEAKIRATAEAAKLEISAFRLEPTPHSHAAAERAVELAKTGEARMLMKGSLHTDELMHAVMNATAGLRTLFVFRIVREIGALAASMGGLDGVVFTAGIGENAADIRARVIERLDWMGAVLDPDANGRSDGWSPHRPVA